MTTMMSTIAAMTATASTVNGLRRRAIPVVR